MKHYTDIKKCILVFLIVFPLLSIQGCDKVSTFFDYFSSKPKEKKAAALQTKTVPPSALSKTSAPGKAKLAGNVLAKVGDWSITIEEFKERLQALKDVAPEYDINDVEQNKMILEELVRQELMVQDAKRKGLDKDKDIAMAVDEFARTLLVREIATTLTEGLETTAQEAEEYYNKNKQDFTEPLEWKVRELIVKNEEEAKAILVEIYQGANFVGFARTKSQGKSAPKNGDLGYISSFEFSKMENAVATLEVGDVSNVFKGPEGYYIIKLEGKRGGEARPFEEIKEDIKAGLTLLKQQQAILSYLDDLRQKTVIEINGKLLEE